MKIEYDKDVDAAFIYFKDIAEGEVNQTISLNDSVNIDLDAEGRTLGIEIIDASKNLPASAIKSAVLIN
ncbi:DUF2283 domain-containing protein [Candidatus Woesearchaeota archaeon]|nr:DUF2283 domain-containing protein [Candidatus Woesearchaeota archaeon]